MSDDPKKPSPEIEKFLEDLRKRYPHIDPKDCREYVPPKKVSERIEEWILEAPRFVFFLCKILYSILNFGGFIFMIIGGIFSLIWAYSIWQLCAASGWHGLFETKATLYIIAYLVLMVIIDKVRSFLFKITYNN